MLYSMLNPRVFSTLVLIYVFRLNAARKDSFLFHMEVLHPMVNPRDETKRLPVTVRSLLPDASAAAEARLVPVTVRVTAG